MNKWRRVYRWKGEIAQAQKQTDLKTFPSDLIQISKTLLAQPKEKAMKFELQSMTDIQLLYWSQCHWSKQDTKLGSLVKVVEFGQITPWNNKVTDLG